ncbi:hypothetical protein E2493_16895 [Sphingomonas parva]|uniref:DUF6468 domain-containing protein n=1 Tax=Sphingomonas parva TaxID=2555898 RepID=A0A4Y8ZM82_9SPHN|nr:DUF6468 domain-containing protein [Sphingomonas parva]TFI57108.1 hypothetical protein E2493_16895 [Sphingomonas parva]
MTFATLTNVVLILLCGAVLVQSVRMMRSFETLKKGGLKDVVDALDKSTAQARVVLGDLKETLRTEGAANARTVAKGEEMREELTVMVGIANAVAERIVETVEAAPKQPAKQADAKQAEPKAAAPQAPREPVKTASETPLPRPVVKTSRPRAKSPVRSKRPAAAASAAKVETV